jgi:hypothetical protein
MNIHRFVSYLFLFCAITVSFPAHAVIFNLNGTFQVDLVRGDDLVGLINTGDTVVVEAFYNTDLAQRVDPVPDGVSPSAGYYNFAAGEAGIKYTVNGLVWEANGPMTVAVEPRGIIQYHEDGTEAATYGGPGWLAYTDPRQTAFLDNPGSIQTPFGMESGIGQFMLYLPTFNTPLPSGIDLPTDLDVSQLAGPFFIHGAVAGDGPNGDYFFNFTSPVPEPETYAMMLAGLGLLGFVSKRRKPE